jgi:NADPH:quinone reductase-like Zn-dependent oxidoreductase
MKAIVRSRYGSPDVLELREIAKPVVRDDEVLVRVRASSVNTADIDYLRGRPAFARITPGLYGLRAPTNRGLGLNVAGQVEAVGTDVTRFRPGDDVFGDMTQHGFGAFAEYVSAPERAFATLPTGMTYEESATLPHAGVLALQGMRSGGKIQPGHRVLINGASGSVGPFAVQIAKALGAEVTGVCSTAKVEMVRSAGADHVIDYTQEDFTRTGQRYDPIVDIAGSHSILACRRALRPRGTYLWVGGPTSRLVQAGLLGPLISIVGNRKMGMLPWKPFPKVDAAMLKDLAHAGVVRPVIDRRYPLSETADALRYLETGTALGKIVITM